MVHLRPFVPVIPNSEYLACLCPHDFGAGREGRSAYRCQDAAVLEEWPPNVADSISKDNGKDQGVVDAGAGTSLTFLVKDGHDAAKS